MLGSCHGRRGAIGVGGRDQSAGRNGEVGVIAIDRQLSQVCKAEALRGRECGFGDDEEAPLVGVAVVGGGVGAGVPGEDEQVGVAAALFGPAAVVLVAAGLVGDGEMPAGVAASGPCQLCRAADCLTCIRRPEAGWTRSQAPQSPEHSCQSGSSAMATISSTSSPRAELRMMGVP